MHAPPPERKNSPGLTVRRQPSAGWILLFQLHHLRCEDRQKRGRNCSTDGGRWRLQVVAVMPKWCMQVWKWGDATAGSARSRMRQEEPNIDATQLKSISSTRWPGMHHSCASPSKCSPRGRQVGEPAPCLGLSEATMQ